MPTVGQVPTATGGTTATWQDPGGGGSSVTGTGLWYSVAGALQAAAATLGDLAVVGGALKVAALSSASAIPVTTALSFGTNPAASGYICAANNQDIIHARNAGNTADLALLYTIGNVVGVGDSNNTQLSLRSGALIEARIAGTSYFNLQNTSADFLALGGTSASAGLLRVANNATAVAARNAANTQNIPLLGTDGSNNVNLGDSAAAQGALTVLNGTTGLSLKVAGAAIGSFQASNSDTLKLGVGATIAKISANDIRFYVGPTSQTVFLKISDGGIGWCQFDVNNGLVINSTGYTNTIGASGSWSINSGINSTNQLQCSMNLCGLSLGGTAQALGAATNTFILYHATTSPTAAPSGGGAIWNDAIGLHYSGTNATSTNFLDYMIAPVLQGTPNTQKMIVRQYCGVARTTTNAAVTILTIPLATATTNGGISVLVEGRDVSAGTVGDGVTIQQIFQFKNVGGTVTQGATVATPLKANDTSMATCTCTATVSSTNILVQVTGLASVVIDWTATGEAITN